MAAENSDAMTLEQFKVYSGKNAGGGGLELLWSGSSSSNVSLSSYDNSGEALLVYFRGLDYTRTFAIVSVDGIGCSSYVRAGSSGNTGSNVTFQYNPDSKTLLNSNKVLVYSVYKFIGSGGGGAVTPDVLWEGNSSQTGTFDPRPYSRLEITGRDAMTTTTTESISAPFEAGKTSEGTGRFTFYYDPFSGGTAAYIQGIEINVLKVTGYR